MAQYRPEIPATVQSIDDLVEFIVREHYNIATLLNAKLENEIEFLTAAPTKLREGLTVGADGTHWNPGSGKGVYTYYSGAWNKLG